MSLRGLQFSVLTALLSIAEGVAVLFRKFARVYSVNGFRFVVSTSIFFREPFTDPRWFAVLFREVTLLQYLPHGFLLREYGWSLRRLLWRAATLGGDFRRALLRLQEKGLILASIYYILVQYVASNGPNSGS